MGASCKITPDAPNGKPSRLFRELKTRFKNRDVAKRLWGFTKTSLFKSEFSDLAKDENGEVKTDALIEALGLDKYLSDSEKDMASALDIGLINADGKEVTFTDAHIAMDKADEFNESARRKIAVVEKTDDGRYRAVVKDNSAMAIAQADRNEARRKLNTSLLRMLQRVGFNVEFAEDPGYDGAFDPLFAEQNAENIRTAIRVSTSKAGLDALPEEVSHLVIAGLKDHNLKQRLDNLMTPEVVRRILGDKYDEYRKRYERAKAPTEQLLKEEAEGQLLASMLKGENPLGENETKNKNSRIISTGLDEAIESGNWDERSIREFNNLINKIQNGKIHFKRIRGKAETYTGRISEAHAGAWVLIGRNEGSSQKEQRDPAKQHAENARKGKEQERIIEAWAKAEDLWLNDYTDEQGNKANTLEDLLESQWFFLNSGSEANVYRYNKNTVLKSISLLKYDDNIELALDRIALFNKLFPSSALSVVSFGRDSLGHFQIIATQNYIEGTELTVDEFKDFKSKYEIKENNGWYKTEDGTAVITDLEPYNILKDNSGNYHVIDADISFNTPSHGGNIEFENSLAQVSEPTKSSGIRNLLSRLWGHAKRLFGKMSEDDVDNAIAQARNVLNPIAESMVDDGAEPMLSKEQIMAHERLYALSAQANEMEQRARDGLMKLEQRLAILKNTLPADDFSEVSAEVSTIEDMISKQQYNLACYNILSMIGKDLSAIAQDCKDLGRIYNNSTDLNTICTECDLVYKLGVTLDGHEQYLSLLSDLPRLISEGQIQMDPSLATPIVEMVRKFNTTITDLQKQRNSLQFNVLKQFISLFYGDNGLRPDSFKETDKIKWESVDQILNGVKEDIPFWDTNLFSAGESRNPLINVVHKIIVKQQAARDSRIRGFCARMQEAEAKLHRAGFNNDFVYQRDSNGKLTGYYKSPIDYDKFDRDEKSFIEELDRNFPNIDYEDRTNRIREWENSHMEESKEVTVDANGNKYKELVPVSSIYGVEDFDKGWSAEQKEYYNALIAIKREMDSFLPLHMRSTYLAPQVRKSISQMFDGGAKNAARTFWGQKKKEFAVVEDNTDYAPQEFTPDFKKDPIKRVPIYYVNKMKDMNDLSTDASHAMFSYITMAVNYSEMGKIASAMRLLQNHVENNYEVTQTSAGQPLIARFASRGRTWTRDWTKVGTDTRAGRALINYIDRLVFGERKIAIGKHEVIAGKSVDVDVLSNLLLKATSVGRIGFNFLSGITNRTQGEAQMIGEATAGRYFNVKDLGWSEKEYAALLGGYVADFNSIDRHDKMYLLINTFNSSEEFFRDMMDRDFNKSAFKRVLGKGNVYFLNSLGEHALHTKGMLAVLKHEKVKVNRKTVSLYDAIKPVHDKNGWRLELSDNVEFVDKNKSFLSDFKDGKIKKSDSEKLFQNLAVYINIMNDYMHGGYSDAEKGNINQHALGRFILQFRQWMFGQYGKMFSKQHADIMTGTITEGSYNSLWRFLAGTVTDMKNMSLKMALEKNKMTPQQWANAKVALAQVGVFQAMAILACLMKGWKDDDDWMKRLISYSVLRLKMETGAQVPFGIDFSNKGWPQVSMTFFTNFLTLVQSPMAATSSLEIITQLMDWTLISSGRFKGWPHALKAAWTLTPFYNIQKVTDMTQYKYMFNIFKGTN